MIRERQPRERAVPCVAIGCHRETWNVSALCDECGPMHAAMEAKRDEHLAAERDLRDEAVA